jgi:two-component system KDP operon response regulator KdpE
VTGARVLIVDDDPAILRIVSRTLGARGYAVETAETAAQFLETVTAFRPDVILLDLVLPDGDGIDLCRALRERGDNTPLLVLSVQGDEPRKVAALEEGADDYITKPFGTGELEARVRVALRRAAGLAREPVLTGGGLRLDLTSHRATI